MRILVLSILVSLSTSSARAERLGLELSGGLQGGHMACESPSSRCNGLSAAFGGNLDAAWFLTPTLGVSADVWVLSHGDDDMTVAHYINTLDLKYRPVPELTLQAGIGAAHATFHRSNGDTRTSKTGFGVMAGASYELLHGPKWALSVDARFGSGFYDMDVKASNVGVGLGLTFFNF